MKHLTEEQKAKLIEALDNFVRVTVWGWDTEYATAINSAIVVIGTAVIEACSQFVKAE